MSKLTSQWDRSTGSSTFLEKKPRALIEPGQANKANKEEIDKTNIDDKSKAVMDYGKSYVQPNRSSEHGIFNLVYRHNSNERG